MSIAQPKRRDHRPINDTVNISLFARGIPGMKVVGNDLHFRDANILFRIAIDRGTEYFGSYLFFEMDVGDLAFSMHACVGAARTIDDHIAAVDSRECPG